MDTLCKYTIFGRIWAFSCTCNVFYLPAHVMFSIFTTDGQIIEPKMSASFVPDHKASMVLFLDRVYGIDNQDFLLHVLEVGFLPDMRAAASLDTVSRKRHMGEIKQQGTFFSSVNSRNLDVDVTYKLSVYLSMEQSVTSFSVSLFPLKVAFSTTEMALALNRYLCSAVLPLLTKCAPLYAGTDHRAIMIDSMLHTIYRLSRGRALTKAQRDVIEECLMSLCKSVSVPVSLFRKKILFIWHLNDDNSK